MKKMYLSFVIPISLFLISCNETTSVSYIKEKTDLEKLNLSGPVKNIVEIMIPAEEKFGGQIETYENFLQVEEQWDFNEDGYQIEYSHIYKGVDTDDIIIGLISLMTDKKLSRKLNAKNKILYEQEWSKFKTTEKTTTTEYEYYEDEQTLKYKKEKKEDKSFSGKIIVIEYHYDDKGNLTQSIETEKLGLFKDKDAIKDFTIIRNQYNTKGQLIEKEQQTTQYNYNWKGEVKDSTSFIIKQMFIYDKYSNIVEEKRIEEEDILTILNKYDQSHKNLIQKQELENGELIKTILFEYDKADRIVSSIIRDAKDGIIEDKKIVYNEQGEIISTELNGETIYRTNLKYKNGMLVRREQEDGIFEFDEPDYHKNWTVCRCFDKYNRITMIKKRKINYYD